MHVQRPTGRRTILVTDGDQRASLAIVRSLGAADHVVFCCSTSGRTISGASRYVRSEHAVANPLTAPAQFADDVTRIIHSEQIDAVIPVTEAALLALLPARDQFRDVLIPFASSDTFQRISDKQTVLATACRVGIAIPAQHVIETANDAVDLHMDGIPFPCVVKPARSVAGAAGNRVKVSVRHAAGPDDLQRILREADPRTYPLLLQQRIVGPGVGVFLLTWNGDTVASFSHRRLREKPPSGGVSVYRESIPMDAALLERSRALLAEFNWDGVAMIEFKMDERTGTPYLMEINGRFWGSLQLAIDAGVDFPTLLLSAAAGEHPSPVHEYRTGVKLRWLWGDVDHLIARLRSSSETLALPPGSRTRWGAVRDFFSHRPGDVSETFRRDDPKPFVRESVEWFRSLHKR